MRFFSNFLKRIKDKIRFEIMTKKEYELFLRKKRMVHNSSFSMNDINTNNSSFFNSNFSMNDINTNNSSFFNSNFSINDVNTNNSSSIHHEINPATGLPMVGGVDAGGNPYGFDSSSSFDHSFQDLGNSYHNDFHHN